MNTAWMLVSGIASIVGVIVPSAIWLFRRSRQPTPKDPGPVQRTVHTETKTTTVTREVITEVEGGHLVVNRTLPELGQSN